MLLSFLCMLARGTESANVAQRGAGSISPALDPISSQKFLKDYPVDKRAVVDKYYVFGHPYPAVQDSNDFDKDFVNDENSDGGKWTAQMEYDTLRAKIRVAKAKMEKLKGKMEQEHEEWLRATKDAENADDALAKATADVAVQKREAEAAKKRVNGLEGRSLPDGTKTGGAVGDAIADVKKEMHDLEKCKEALAKAKERLKNAVKEQAEAADVEAKKDKEEKEEEAAAAAEAAKAAEAAEDEKRKKDEKEQKTKRGKKAKSKAKDKDADKRDWKKEIDEDTQEVSTGRKNYLKELEDVRRTEKQLEEAAKTLKKFRRSPNVDDDGGVYNVPSKSMATAASCPLAFAMMAVAVIVATFA